MATTMAERDRTVPAVTLTVLASGAVMSAVAWGTSGPAVAASVGAGAAIALANLLVITLTVRALLGGDARRLPWGLMAVTKIAFLFGGIYWLADQGVVALLPLAIGYGALPLGIVFSQLAPQGRSPEEG